MNRIITSTFFCLMFSLFLACSDSSSKDVINENCPKQSKIVSNQDYANLTTANYTITGVALNENCVDITFSSSGCSGSTWQTNLFSTNNFPDTFPEQRVLKLKLVNEEACLAVISKTVSFDLTPLRISGQHQVTLKIDGWNQQVVYNY